MLLDGLHDPESCLNKLREPNDVRRPVMEMIWDQVAENWQVHSSPIVLTSPSLTRSLSSHSDLIYLIYDISDVRRWRFFLFGFLFIAVDGENAGYIQYTIHPICQYLVGCVSTIYQRHKKSKLSGRQNFTRKKFPDGARKSFSRQKCAKSA